MESKQIKTWLVVAVVAVFALRAAADTHSGNAGPGAETAAPTSRPAPQRAKKKKAPLPTVDSAEVVTPFCQNPFQAVCNKLPGGIAEKRLKGRMLLQDKHALWQAAVAATLKKAPKSTQSEVFTSDPLYQKYLENLYGEVGKRYHGLSSIGTRIKDALVARVSQETGLDEKTRALLAKAVKDTPLVTSYDELKKIASSQDDFRLGFGGVCQFDGLASSIAYSPELKAVIVCPGALPTLLGEADEKHPIELEIAPFIFGIARALARVIDAKREPDLYGAYSSCLQSGFDSPGGEELAESGTFSRYLSGITRDRWAFETGAKLMQGLRLSLNQKLDFLRKMLGQACGKRAESVRGGQARSGYRLHVLAPQSFGQIMSCDPPSAENPSCSLGGKVPAEQ